MLRPHWGRGAALQCPLIRACGSSLTRARARVAFNTFGREADQQPPRIGTSLCTCLHMNVLTLTGRPSTHSHLSLQAQYSERDLPEVSRQRSYRGCFIRKHSHGRARKMCLVRWRRAKGACLLTTHTHTHRNQRTCEKKNVHTQI